MVEARIMPFCYILYSSSIDRFQIGNCHDLTGHYKNHLDKFYPNSYTTKADDWGIFYSAELDTITAAIRFEKYIKKMKSRKYIQEHKSSPQLGLNLKLKFLE
jgi:putative endonuclease